MKALKVKKNKDDEEESEEEGEGTLEIPRPQDLSSPMQLTPQRTAGLLSGIAPPSQAAGTRALPNQWVCEKG